MADKIIMLHEGSILYKGASREVIQSIFDCKDERFIPYLPSISKLYLAYEVENQVDKIPLNVKEGRQWWQAKAFYLTEPNNSIQEKKDYYKRDKILTLQHIYFQYGKDLPFVLKNCFLNIYEDEFYALVGGNDSGKSTLLQVSMGILRQQRGKIKFKNRDLKNYRLEELVSQFAYLPQHPLSFYIEDTIEAEMNAIINKHRIPDGLERKKKLCERLGICHLLNRHPNDLSGGELQRATLACLLLQRPTILFIDEPTKGLDPISKYHLGTLLEELKHEGLTIFMVTHDIEFAVQYVDRCAILFDRQITVEGTPEQLFKGNYFYTTAINRITTTNNMDGFLTLEEAMTSWEKAKGT